MTLRDVCFHIAKILDEASIKATLTGGAAATIYAPDAISSQDADFILSFSGDSKAAHDALTNAGYSLRNGMYESNKHPFTVEFPRGPLAIGSTNEPIETIEISEGDSRLSLLSVTDCIKDRLAGYYAWDDPNSLRQAIAVAKANADLIELPRLRKWSEAEDRIDSSMRALTKFQRFVNRLDS